MASFVNFARIASICVGFHLGTLQGYFSQQDFWPNLNFQLEYQINLVLKCYELLDKITSSLATFETLISLNINNGTVGDAKEFHKLQTLYLQLMTHVRNIDRKMKVETEESFQKTIMNDINNLKKLWNKKYLVAVYAC